MTIETSSVYSRVQGYVPEAIPAPTSVGKSRAGSASILYSMCFYLAVILKIKSNGVYVFLHSVAYLTRLYVAMYLMTLAP